MTKDKLYFVFLSLRVLASAILTVPLIGFAVSIPIIAAQPTPDMFLTYIAIVIAGVVIGKPLLKFSNLKILQLSSELELTNQHSFFKKCATIVVYAFSALCFYVIGATKHHVKTEYGAANNISAKNSPAQVLVQPQIVPAVDVEFTFNEAASRLMTQSYWGTCTFLLFKSGNKSGGTKIYDSAPNCVAKFKDYFKKYACNDKSDIKQGQLNFGKKLNYDRVPASDYYVLVSAKCN